MIDELAIGLSSWIIQDGNYPDFEVDREYDFALEFSVQEWAGSVASARSLSLVGPAIYAFSGQVMLAEPCLTILDVASSASRTVLHLLCFGLVRRSRDVRTLESIRSSGSKRMQIDQTFPVSRTAGGSMESNSIRPPGSSPTRAAAR